VTGTDSLRELVSDTTLTATLKDGVTAVAHYNADGTGTLRAWGDTFPRRWEIKGDDQLCFDVGRELNCFTIERDASSPGRYRGRHVDTGDIVVFDVQERQVTVVDKGPTSQGGAAQPSAQEMAEKLSNPTSPVASIGNIVDVTRFDGDLPGASDQTGVRYTFQTAFPFPYKGGSIFFRPAIPVVFKQPVPDGSGGFDSVGVDLADIGFDFSYGRTAESGVLYGGGLGGTFPVATNDALGKDKWSLGPQVLLGYIAKWGAVGGLVGHQWDYAGSGEARVNVTGGSYFYAFNLGNGTQIAASPTFAYDHEAESGNRLTLPLGIGLAKTTIIKGRPWKFQLQYWYYVAAPEAFGPRHQIRLAVLPVVQLPWQ
jgi:hypothetical protein